VTATVGEPETVRRAVRERYGEIARDGTKGCCDGTSGGCGCASTGPGGTEGDSACCDTAYSPSDLASLPEGANLGLGCGNPTRLTPLRAGEVVLDLGSGAGVDCFLAAERVGPNGRVIGVDMIPEMVARARALATTGRRSNVEFRLGEIEHLPVPDASVDVVLSNCVINLALDQRQVYREAFRVLRPGGRLAVADVLATRPIPDEYRADPERWASCSSGALTPHEVTELLQSVGFEGIDVNLLGSDPVSDSLRAQSELGVVPGEVRATKPGSVRE
jgi:arsenite methyltransferase